MKHPVHSALAWAALLACLQFAKAQPPRTPPRLILSAEPIEKAPRTDADLRPNALRPNLTQELLTYLQNDGAETRKVVVQLLAGGVVVASQQKEVGSGKFVPLVWPSAPTTPAAVPVKTPALTELTRPVAFRLMDAKGQALGKDVPLEVDRPSYYLDAELDFVPARGEEKNRLIATVTPNARFKGLRCPVQLMLDPERISGFIAGQKKGVYAGFVTGEKRGDGLFGPLYLVAEDIQRKPDERDGVVTLRADGYNRAFTFRTTFAHSGTKPKPQERSKESLRLDVARAADPRKPVRVGIEADNLEQPADARLVLDVLSIVVAGEKKAPSEQFSQLAEFRGERSVQLFYARGGKHGGLLIRPEVKDWNADLDLGGLHGTTTLRLRLLDRDNKPREVLDADTGKRTTEIRKIIFLDDTPPEDVRFEPPPTGAVRTRPLILFASGMDEESGVRHVVFFLGKLPTDAKLLPDALAVPGSRVRKGSNLWTAELRVPADARPVLDVSVRFTNNAGLSTTEVIQLAVVDPPPPPVKAAKKASIAGAVTEGDRTQKSLPVELQDAAGKVLAKTETGAGGAFLFKDLAPGDYQVSAVKIASDTKGVTPVKLAAGEDKNGIVIQLWR